MKKVLLLMVSILCCGMAATCTATVPTSAIAVGSAVPGMSVQALVQSYGQPQYSRDGEKLTFRNGLRAEVR